MCLFVPYVKLGLNIRRAFWLKAQDHLQARRVPSNQNTLVENPFWYCTCALLRSSPLLPSPLILISLSLRLHCKKVALQLHFMGILISIV